MQFLKRFINKLEHNQGAEGFDPNMGAQGGAEVHKMTML